MNNYESVQKLPIKKIKWLDATDRSDIKVSDLNKKKIDINLLTERVSVGWVIREDKDKIVLVTDVTEEGLCEITTIPKGWVVL